MVKEIFDLIKINLDCNIDLNDKLSVKIDHNGISIKTKEEKEHITIDNRPKKKKGKKKELPPNKKSTNTKKKTTKPKNKKDNNTDKK